MFLNDKEITKLQRDPPPLIQKAPDFSLQLQSNGFDLTVKEVHEFSGQGSVDFSNHDRLVPETKELKFLEDWLELKKGAYKIKTNEIVHLPNDVIAFAQTRSSLLRMGCFTAHGFWDAGFKGRSEFLLVVENPLGLKLKKDARIAQMVFIRLGENVGKPYEGIYTNLD